MSGNDQPQEANDDTAGASGLAGSSMLRSIQDQVQTRTEYSFSIDINTRYVLALSTALFVGFSVYLALRYWSYNLTGSDFGSYVHMFATTLGGDGWLEQGKYIASHPNGSYWGGHFSLTLLGFIPVFALFSSPLTLVVIKSFVLAASVVVLWVLARNRLESDRFALLVTVSYALNPFLWSAWMFDFQEQILLPPLLFGVYYAYANARRSVVWHTLFVLLLALVLFTNEFVVLLVGGFLFGAAAAAYRNDRFMERLPLLVAGAIVTLIVRFFAGWVITYFSTLSGIPPASIAGPIRPFVEGSYATIPELASIFLAHPAVMFQTLATNGFTKAVYVIVLFVPVLFLSLRDETTIGALAPFFAFAWVFTGRDAYYTFSAHYPLYLLPFVYIGAVRVLARIEGEYSLVTGSETTGDSGTGLPLNATGALLSRLFVIVLVVSAVGSMAVVADKHDPLATPDDHDELRSTALETIPPDASIITQNDLFPHIATRPSATYIPNEGTFEYYRQTHGLPTPKYIVYDTTTAWSRVISEQYASKLGIIYGAYEYQDGIWVWKRGFHGSPTGISSKNPRISQYDLDAFTLKGGTRSAGRIVATNLPPNGNIWFGPKTQLPPGTYAVTFRMNATRTRPNASGPVARVDVVHSIFHKRIAVKPVMPTHGDKNVTVRFTLNQPRENIEFRGFSAGRGGTVSLKSVDVKRTGPSWTVSGLGAFGVNKGERRNGTIVGTNVSTDQSIWFGPYATLPPGTYTVAYEMNVTRTDTNNEPVVAVDVAAGENHRRLARKTVRQTYGVEQVHLTFTLHQTQRLVEFRGFSATRNGTVRLKSVTVNRTGTARENAT